MKIYLYVKKHSITGLKYFGKTTKPDPYAYLGSGLYWKKHISKHGVDHVITEEVWAFDNIDECSGFAEKFSIDHDIVESELWANLKPENGRDGGSPKTGRPLSEDHKAKISQSLHGRVFTDEHRANISKSVSGMRKSDVQRRKMSEAKKGKPIPQFQTEESRRKLSESLMGHSVSDDLKARLSFERTGEGNPFHGKSHSEHTRRIMAEKAREKAKGRFWIVNQNGDRRACYDLNDPRLLSGEFKRGMKWVGE